MWCAGRMSKIAANLVSHVSAHKWVLTMSVPLRVLPAGQPGPTAQVPQGRAC